MQRKLLIIFLVVFLLAFGVVGYFYSQLGECGLFVENNSSVWKLSIFDRAAWKEFSESRHPCNSGFIEMNNPKSLEKLRVKKIIFLLSDFSGTYVKTWDGDTGRIDFDYDYNQTTGTFYFMLNPHDFTEVKSRSATEVADERIALMINFFLVESSGLNQFEKEKAFREWMGTDKSLDDIGLSLEIL